MDIQVDETLSGWNVIRKCPVCKNSPVFVHNSRDKDRAINAVNIKFSEVHLECSFISAD
jgi:hypothetical protein